VARAAGRSALRSLLSPILVALMLGAIAVSIFNPIVAATTKQYEVVASRYKEDGSAVLSISREGLWLRQGNSAGQTVVHARRANLDGTKFFSVTFIGFSVQGRPTYRAEADSAELMPGEWVAQNVKLWQLAGGDNPERDAELLPVFKLESDLTRDKIRDSFGTPSSIPIWELPAFIDGLERAGFSARQHRLWFQMELALPLMLAAMVMIGAGFTMRHTRFGRTGPMVLMAILCGFATFFIRNFAQILGENGQIPIALAAWAPPVAAVLMTLGLLLHLEDG
jgi:lipopolysaccharide export system permease protein